MKKTARKFRSFSEAEKADRDFYKKLTGNQRLAAFSAVVLFAIGRGAASTKYAALSSLGNVPVVYMTAVDGWVHDRFGTGWMLQTDALSAIVLVVGALFGLKKINAARAQGLAAG